MMMIYRPAKFHADRCQVAEIIYNQTEKKTATNVPFRTNRWRAVIKDCILEVLYCWSYLQTRSLARPLCDSRAICFYKRRIVDCIIKLISQGRMSALGGG